MSMRTDDVFAILSKRIDMQGATPSQIQEAVNKYLSENPVDSVTEANILKALGYIPADQEDVNELNEKIVQETENLSKDINRKADKIIATAQGKNIVVSDSSDDSIQNLKLYGKTTQGENPSPDKPQPLENKGKLGDSGQMEIESGVLGWNLFDKANVNMLNQCYFDVGNPKITQTVYATSIYIPCEPNHTYTISKMLTSRFFVGETSELPTIGVKVSNVINGNGLTTVTITTSENAKYIVAYVLHSNNDSGVTINDLCNSLMINYGTTPLPYRPYTKQSHTNFVGNGLNGIPLGTTIPDVIANSPILMSGVYWDEEDGQYYISDTVDNESGVLVQRVWKGKPLKTIVFTIRDEDGRCSIFNNPFEVIFKKGNVQSMSTIALWSSYATGDRTFALNLNEIYYKDSTKTLEEVNAMFAEIGTNFEVAGVLETPIETPLTAEEIESYKALHSNYPYTTVMNNCDAHMEFEYDADTKCYIDNLEKKHNEEIAELRTAIIALGGTL